MADKLSKNFRYSNGLECKAPTWRIKAYEAIVPFLALAMFVIGSYKTININSDEDWFFAFTSIAITLVAWALLSAAFAVFIFKFWCKPIHKSKEGKSQCRTQAKK